RLANVGRRLRLDQFGRSPIAPQFPAGVGVARPQPLRFRRARREKVAVRLQARPARSDCPAATRARASLDRVPLLPVMPAVAVPVARAVDVPAPHDYAPAFAGTLSRMNHGTSSQTGAGVGLGSRFAVPVGGAGVAGTSGKGSPRLHGMVNATPISSSETSPVPPHVWHVVAAWPYLKRKPSSLCPS